MSDLKKPSHRPVARSKAALPSWQKRTLYAVSFILWLSGVVWLYFQYFTQTREFGPGTYPEQVLSLKIHGAAAMVFLLGLGALLIQHVPIGWRQKDQRPSGISVLTVCGLLVLTGWGLYYLGDERWRQSASTIHSVIGLLFPVLLAIHVWLAARRLKPPKEKTKDH